MLKRITILLVFVCAFALRLPAQSTAQVSGTVQDSSGAVLPGAQVTMTNVDTNAVRTTQTSDTGAYTFPSLPIGPYKLEVTKDGFTTYVQTGIVLQVNSNPTVDVTMQVGSVTQQVEVQANAAMVETQSTGIGQVIDDKRVVDLPLNGRNVTQLIALSGGAVSASNGTTAAAVGASVGNITASQLNYPTVAVYSVAGGVANGTNYTLDGGDFIDVRSDVGFPFPFPDAVQEFKVETSSLPAEYGRHPGGAVSANTRSGTNALHGDAFEFLRNGDVNSRDYFAPTRDSLKRNQFGGVVGGPVRRDKIFFFTGFQGTTVRTAPQTNIAFVPTAATLNGDFRAMLAPPCQPKQVNLNASSGAVGNVIPKADLNPIALKFLALVPVSTDPCGKLVYGVPQNYNEYQGVGRADWQRSSKDSLFFRFFATDYSHPYNFVGNLLTDTTTFQEINDRVTSLNIGDTYLVSPNAINSVRLIYNRSATGIPSPAGVPTMTQLGTQMYSPTPNYTGMIQISNYFSVGIFPSHIDVNVFGASDTFTWNRGKHQITTGFSWEQIQMNSDIPSFTNGRMSFTGQNTGNALADLEVGNMDTWLQGADQTGHERQNEPSLFAEDSWSITPKLKLNAGIRWDPFLPQQQRAGILSNFDPANYAAGIVSKTFVNAPAGMIFPGDSAFPTGRSDYFPKYAEFSPRIGIVWDPRGKGEETIRAGYGIFEDSNFLFITQQMSLNEPYAPVITFPGQISINNPWANYAGGDPFPWPSHPASNIQFIPLGKYAFMPLHPNLPYIQQWNLSVQKQFGKDWLASATYLGNKTTHQWLGINQNAPILVPGTVQAGNCTSGPGGGVFIGGPFAGKPDGLTTVVTPSSAAVSCSSVANEPDRYPIAGYGIMNTLDPSGNAAYNGLLLSINHRFSHNFSALANYTWSHCLNQGDGSADIGIYYQNQLNRKAEWGNCAVDRRNVVNVSVIAASRGIGDTITKHITDDWTFSAIYTYIAGPWVNLLDGTDVSLTANGKDRPNLIGNWHVPNPSVTEWFNPAAFQNATPGSYGDFGRNGILGPSNWNIDLGLWRDFPIHEAVKLTVRFEAFNSLNHAQFGPPVVTLNAGNVGQLTTDPKGPRILQAAMKLSF